MKKRIAGISVFVNVILAALKITAGLISSSVSVLSEGLNSGMDIFSSLINLLAIKASGKPVDKEHPYGHYKFEVLAGFIITILLFGTGSMIIYKALQSMFVPTEILINKTILGIMLVSALTNEIMSRLKLYYGKKENSIALISDGVHSRVDAWTSAAVLAGLFLNKYWIYTDSVLALLIGVYIVIKSFSLGKEATDSLLDSSANAEEEQKIRKIAGEKNIEIAELKTQKKGPVITANMKIKLPKDLSVEEATIISNSLKSELIEKMGNLNYVSVQIENSDYTTSYFKSREMFGFARRFEKGFGWQVNSIQKENTGEVCSKTPEDFCVCIKCGHKEPHKKGTPCKTEKCKICGSRMKKNHL